MEYCSDCNTSQINYMRIPPQFLMKLPREMDSKTHMEIHKNQNTTRILLKDKLEGLKMAVQNLVYLTF
jgi:hypothetical protein